MANVAIFFAVFLLCCGYALWRGGAPERIGAGIFIAGMLLSRVAATSVRPAFTSMEAGILLVDACMLAGFVLLALRSRRFWPIWMSAMQAVEVAGHAARFVDPRMMPWVYAIAQGIWSYPMLALLAVATRRHRQRLKLTGADRPWSGAWQQSGLSAPMTGVRG